MPEPEETPEDQLAILRSQLDQELMLAPEVARAAFAFYSSFVKAGFNEHQALTLTINQLDG